MQLGPAPLLAAASYAIDLTLDGCTYHGWRVAVLAHRMASLMAPDIANDIFFAGLLHGAGAVGFEKPNNVTNLSHELQVNQKSSALTRWLPGMRIAADCMGSMFEIYGCFSVNEEEQEIVFLGSQILRLADSVDAVGSFNSTAGLAGSLHALSAHTGKYWTKDIWTVFLEVIREPDLFHSLSDHEKLGKVMMDELSSMEMPEELNNESGTVRVMHLIAALVDVKNPSTAGHSLRVARYSKELAETIGLSDEECETVYRSGLVHDLGRLGLPSEIINREGIMDNKQMLIVRRHSSMTIDALSCLPNCPEMAELGNTGAHDHEWYDGNGYPHGLSGDDIPLLSRIIGVADAYDAMTTPQDYRLLSPKAALVRLRQGAGTQFDPVIVEALVNAVNTGQIAPELQNAA